MSVLVVDDDCDVVEYLCSVLEYNGHRVVGVAYDGKEAVNKYFETFPRPELIIMDFRMPTMNGIEAVTEIISKDPEARIVISSADCSLENDFLKSGAVRCLHKPYSTNDLLKIHSELN